MTDTVLTALIIAIPPTIGSTVTGIIALLNHLQGRKIHVLVNSNLSMVKSDLALANEHIQKLQHLVAELTSKSTVQT